MLHFQLLWVGFVFVWLSLYQLSEQINDGLWSRRLLPPCQSKHRLMTRMYESNGQLAKEAECRLCRLVVFITLI